MGKKKNSDGGAAVVTLPLPPSPYDQMAQIQGQALQIAKPTEGLRLDLACGQSCQPGFEGVDVAPGPGVKHVLNLLNFPWSFADGSVAEITCSHFIEHVPAAFWSPKHGVTLCPVDETSVDLLLKFFDECHRILQDGGIMKVICPPASSDRGFQDPTHRRFIVPATFMYTDASWRAANRLTHGIYGVSCHFEGNVGHSLDQAENLRHPESQAYRFMHLRNVVVDWHVVMKKAKPPANNPFLTAPPGAFTPGPVPVNATTGSLPSTIAPGNGPAPR